VHNVITAYNRHGPAVVEGAGKGAPRRAYLSREEEVRFLEEYQGKAAKGEAVAAREIHRGFERLFGRAVDKSAISRLHERHDWRAVAPRN